MKRFNLGNGKEMASWKRHSYELRNGWLWKLSFWSNRPQPRVSLWLWKESTTTRDSTFLNSCDRDSFLDNYQNTKKDCKTKFIFLEKKGQLTMVAKSPFLTCLPHDLHRDRSKSSLFLFPCNNLIKHSRSFYHSYDIEVVTHVALQTNCKNKNSNASWISQRKRHWHFKCKLNIKH